MTFEQVAAEMIWRRDELRAQFNMRAHTIVTRKDGFWEVAFLFWPDEDTKSDRSASVGVRVEEGCSMDDRIAAAVRAVREFVTKYREPLGVSVF